VIITTERSVTELEVDRIREWAEGAGLRTVVSRGESHTIIGCLGDTGGVAKDTLLRLPGVADVHAVPRPYELASRQFRAEYTTVRVGEGGVGGDGLFVMAGPCSVEGPEMLLTTGRAVADAGAQAVRGGAFKPRTSPYTFRGLGEEGLRLLSDVRAETGLPVVTEVMSPDQVDLVARYADVLQIGARNMQNYDLLLAAGRTRRPVLLKRGLCATVSELRLAAEYLLSQGNPNVILCERGIRTFETATRNTLDLSIVPVLRRETHLPVIVDPSHAAGDRELVVPLAVAAAAVGADGLMVEVHPDPDDAWSDGGQSLDLEGFRSLMGAVDRVVAATRGLDRRAAPNTPGREVTASSASIRERQETRT